jgi:2-polyprenyl-3-methyl-5-hydroxy-6-metoxy-1,4-benzoquinol methylase
VSLVPEGVERALEVACAEGHFTVRLAERVRRVHAVDISAIALQRARARCRDLPHVTFGSVDVFAEDLPCEHDVVVCSEVLYYAGDRDRLAQTVRRLVRAVAPGGVLIHAHANAVADDPHAPGFDWDVPYGARAIEGALLAHGGLELERDLRTPLYRVQRFRRRARRRPWRSRRRVAPEGVEPARELPADGRRGSCRPAARSGAAPRRRRRGCRSSCTTGSRRRARPPRGAGASRPPSSTRSSPTCVGRATTAWGWTPGSRRG